MTNLVQGLETTTSCLRVASRYRDVFGEIERWWYIRKQRCRSVAELGFQELQLACTLNAKDTCADCH